MTQQSVVAQEEWSGREELAEAMIPQIGRLNRKNNVVTSIYGRKLINQSAIDIIKAHRIVRRIEGAELDLNATKAILAVVEELNVGSVSVDLGRLNKKFVESGAADLKGFVASELGEKVGQAGATDAEPQDVVLYGFGRIGRLLARILIEKTGGGDGLRLRAIVVRKGAENDLVKRASLLRRDSVHGRSSRPFTRTPTTRT